MVVLKATANSHSLAIFSSNVRLREVINAEFYRANPKTVNTRIISGMLSCCEEKANQMQDEKNASCNGN